MRVAAGCLIQRGNKFLLVRRSITDKRRPETWEQPGGRKEEGETPEQTAIRETKEESGIDVKIIKLIGEDKVNIHGEVKSYYSYLAEGEGEVKLSHEHDDFNWLTKEEILEMAKDQSKKLGLHVKNLINRV